ncbi:MAG: hypothetical protein KAI53_03645, partial [Candidatus Aenigmarchaeota archaeon]|nr:hypothetical protein [Candidatus Aenigmarchaeota archaeon]
MCFVLNQKKIFAFMGILFSLVLAASSLAITIQDTYNEGVTKDNISFWSYDESACNMFDCINGGNYSTNQTPSLNVTDNLSLIEPSEIKKYKIKYLISAPKKYETLIARGKRIVIYSNESIPYYTATVFADILNLGYNHRLYRSINNIRVDVTDNPIHKVVYPDIDPEGNYNRIPWNVPRLLNDMYEIIIEISTAEHLDENKEFISDIYNETYRLDDIWSEAIPEGHYVRIAFEKNLTSDRDITIYPRVVSGNPRIQVYEINGTELIAEFTSLNSNEYNKVYLTGLEETQDTFDLLILNGVIEFD